MISVIRELEPYDGKLSSTVLRGQGWSNPPALPNKNCFLIIILQLTHNNQNEFGLPKKRIFVSIY